MREVTVKVYKFSELDPKVQAKVLDKHREWNTDHDWAESMLDYHKEKATERGFNVEDIHYSGFGSQGDGASWIGSINVIPWLEKNDPDSPLLQFREVFEEYCQTIKVAQQGHYVHSNTMYLPDNDLGCVEDEIIELDMYEAKFREANICKSIKTLETDMLADAKDFAKEIYKALEDEYEYLTSDEAVKESIESNDLEFYANGTVF